MKTRLLFFQRLSFMSNKTISITSIKAMDSYRWILAIFVFIVHIISINIYPLIGSTWYFQVICWMIWNFSVLIFFLLSWILISHSAFSLTENKIFHWKKYLINRISRILPAYFFALLLSCFLLILFIIITGSAEISIFWNEQYIAREIIGFSILDFIFSIFLLPSWVLNINGPLWSLYIEWWLYIVFMFLLMWVYAKNLKYKITYLLVWVWWLCLTFYVNELKTLG